MSRLMQWKHLRLTPFKKDPNYMKQRFPCLVLLLVMAGGTFAAVPLHFGEGECSVDGMMDMECCNAAVMQTEKPEVTVAKLFCALNCAQNGTTLPMGSIRVTAPSLAGIDSHPASTHPLPSSSLRFRRSDRLHRPPGAAPTYLRHLALLI